MELIKATITIILGVEYTLAMVVPLSSMEFAALHFPTQHLSRLQQKDQLILCTTLALEKGEKFHQLVSHGYETHFVLLALESAS